MNSNELITLLKNNKDKNVLVNIDGIYIPLEFEESDEHYFTLKPREGFDIFKILLKDYFN